MLLLLVALLPHLSGAAVPGDCFSAATSVYKVYDCLKNYVIPRDFIKDEAQFAQTVPSDAEKADIARVLGEALSSLKCPANLGTLANTLACVDFLGKAVIFHEKTLNSAYFKRGWGIVGISTIPSVGVHLLSNNPGSTGGLVASLASSENPKSFLVAGMKPDAYRNRNANLCQSTKYPSDASGNPESFFHQAALAIAKSDGPVIQFNKMSSGVCSDLDVFIPSGALVDALKSVQPTWSVSAEAGKCSCGSETNILDRFLNGVPENEVCSKDATGFSGRFVDVQTSSGSSQTRSGSSWRGVLALAFPGGGPEACFESGVDVGRAFICYREYILPANHILNAERYKSILPTAQQLADWQAVIGGMLESGKCPASLPASISNQAGCAQLKDAAVLFEKKTSDCRALENGVCSERAEREFADKGWGFFAATSDPSFRSVHLSAAHPISDGNVGIQVANMFGPLKAKSVMVSGTRRDSFKDKSLNLCQGTLGKGYYPPDGAHNNVTMFHQSLLAIAAWQKAKGCTMDRCAFFQYHGMAGDSCPEDVFISTGTTNSSYGLKYLANDKLPVRRVQDTVRKHHPDWNVGTSHTSSCHLFGSTNVFGRLLNGADQATACVRSPGTSTFTGLFVHLEQKDSVKNGLDWVAPLSEIFPLN